MLFYRSRAHATAAPFRIQTPQHGETCLVDEARIRHCFDAPTIADRYAVASLVVTTNTIALHRLTCLPQRPAETISARRIVASRQSLIDRTSIRVALQVQSKERGRNELSTVTNLLSSRSTPSKTGKDRN